MASTVTIPTRYQGPPGTANGGCVAGLLAAAIGPTATVRLEAAVPLDTELHLAADGDGVALRSAEARVAVAHAADPPPAPPAAVPRAQAEATVGPTAAEHAFPQCFVCGPSAADGLHITPGPLADPAVVATTWVPDPGRADLDVERLAWAALDCPSGLAVMRDGTAAVLGTLTGHLRRPLEPGEPVVVVGRLDRIDGRKRFASSALYDVDGEPIAWSEAVWIELAR